MTIMQYWIVGWIAVGVFAIFAMTWLIGLITDQPSLRFFCDFLMVIALFGMLVGFGGRYKQIRLANARKEAAALKRKKLTKAETAFKDRAQEAYDLISSSSNDISGSWSKAVSDAKKAAKKAKTSKSKGKTKKTTPKTVSPSEAVSSAFKKHKDDIAKAQKLLTDQKTYLTRIYQYGAKANYQKYQTAEKKEVAYYNAVVSINKLTLPKYQEKVKTAKAEYLAAWRLLINS
ncbi:hypothetical protein [Lactobacillus equicursoris]|uniref:hypothetical protein n=1 Tax=Lactobacillus equicursoris TaxID=420645 RepID=UPI00242ABB27|nr:hypothetical protein [Lactobacillus equicursoris]MDD6386087.1 hypothetical protein [Lactobacillus equicursoris]